MNPRLYRKLLFITSLISFWALLSFAAIFLECPTFLKPFLRDNANVNNYTNVSFPTRRIYIPGAGFSGFFYTLGRLHSIHSSATEQYDDEYYCFSAGCLALVATLMEVPLDRAVEMAHASRKKWITGEIGRYDVVKYFVDELLYDRTFADSSRLTQCNSKTETKKQMQCNLSNSTQHIWSVGPQHKIYQHLSKINIITSTWKGNPIITQSIRSPSTVLELKQMLLQTTWIPFITGPTLGDIDEFGNYHNDGAFAALLHGWSMFKENAGTEQYTLKLPWDAELLYNGLNIVLDHDKAIRFWNIGYCEVKI